MHAGRRLAPAERGDHWLHGRAGVDSRCDRPRRPRPAPAAARSRAGTRRGRADPAFNHGQAAAFAPQRFSAATGVVVDAQGRILVSATLDDGLLLHPRAAVLRLLPSGALDATFGAGGVATVEPPAPSLGTRAEDLALDAAGRVVVAGEVDDDVPALMRLLPDGRPDLAFGSGGIAVARGAYNGAPAWWQSLALAGSDIVVAGAAVNTPPYGSGLDRQPVLARFTDAGLPDATFAAGGFLLLELPGFALPVPHALAVDQEGRIDVGLASSATSSSPRVFSAEVVRLARFGAIDTTFGSAGTALLGVQRAPTLHLAVRASGALLVLGGWASDLVGAPVSMAAQLTPAGQLDEAFGTHGRLAARQDYSGSAVADCGGNLIVASGSVLHRLGPDLRPDPSFRGAATVTATVGATSVTQALGPAALAPGGAVVLVGTLSDGPSVVGGPPGAQVGNSAIVVQRLIATCPVADTRPPAVSLRCAPGCRRMTGTALDDPVGRGVRRVLLGVVRRSGKTCEAWNGRRFRALPCGRAAAALVSVPVVRGAFRSPPLPLGATVVRAVAIDRAGNRSAVAVRRVAR